MYRRTYCFVVAGKIDEAQYDRIMEFVTDRMNLFASDYSNDWSTLQVTIVAAKAAGID